MMQREVLAPLGMCRFLIARHNEAPLDVQWLTSLAKVVTAKLTGRDLTLSARAARRAPTVLQRALIREADRPASGDAA
jgi:hypothetical protein